MKICYAIFLNILFSFSLYAMDRDERIKAIEHIIGCKIEREYAFKSINECINKNVMPKFMHECELNKDNKTFSDVQKCANLKMQSTFEQIKKFEKTN